MTELIVNLVLFICVRFLLGNCIVAIYSLYHNKDFMKCIYKYLDIVFDLNLPIGTRILYSMLMGPLIELAVIGDYIYNKFRKD